MPALRLMLIIMSLMCVREAGLIEFLCNATHIKSRYVVFMSLVT